MVPRSTDPTTGMYLCLPSTPRSWAHFPDSSVRRVPSTKWSCPGTRDHLRVFGWIPSVVKGRRGDPPSPLNRNPHVEPTSVTGLSGSPFPWGSSGLSHDELGERGRWGGVPETERQRFGPPRSNCRKGVREKGPKRLSPFPASPLVPSGLR